MNIEHAMSIIGYLFDMKGRISNCSGDRDSILDKLGEKGYLTVDDLGGTYARFTLTDRGINFMEEIKRQQQTAAENVFYKALGLTPLSDGSEEDFTY